MLESVICALGIVGTAAGLLGLWAKFMEKPQLKVQLGNTHDDGGRTPDDPRLRLVHVEVVNPPIPRLLRWLTYRQSAQRVRLKVSYTPILGTKPKYSVEGRWTANPEPIEAPHVRGEKVLVFHPWLVYTGRFIDIASGDRGEEALVVIKRDGEEDCFVFDNEAYFPHGVDPQKRLPKGTYRVTVTAIAGAVQSKPTEFLLFNEGPALEDLRLDIPNKKAPKLAGVSKDAAPQLPSQGQA